MVSLSTLLKVLQALLQEQVPVRDIRTIAEAIANVAAKSQDPAAMVAAVRALSRNRAKRCGTRAGAPCDHPRAPVGTDLAQ